MKNEIFDKVKRAVTITQVVEHFHGKLDRNGFVLCPFHHEKTASLSVEKERNIFSCWGCNERGDQIHFVAKLKGIKQSEAAKLIAQEFGLSDIVSNESHGVGSLHKKRNQPPRDAIGSSSTQSGGQGEPDEPQSEESKRLIAAYVEKCFKNQSRADYLKNERGFTVETIERFKLGYDSYKNAIVIPYPPNSHYFVRRLFDPPIGTKNYRKPEKHYGGNDRLFNAEALSGNGVVFIVESQLCAISIIQSGGNAVGLGGLANIKMLLKEIEKQNSECIFIVALDNDEPGREGLPKLIDGLKKLRVRFIQYDVSAPCKDPNELLKKDSAALTANIQAAIKAAEKTEEVPKMIDKESQVKVLLATQPADPLAVFKTEYVDALAYAKDNLPSEYAVFKAMIKGKVNMNDLDNAVRIAQAKSKRATDEQPLVLEGINLGNATAPKGWTVSLGEGVRRTITTRDCEREIIACPDAVVVTRRLLNFDDEKERVEIAFFKDKRWRKITATRALIYNKSAIIGYGDMGLSVSSGTASNLVDYLFDYESKNKDTSIPLITSIARIGWLTDTEFFPFATNSEVSFEDDSPSLNIYQSLTDKGDYSKWKEMMRKLRKNPFARFLTSASFAAPLLKPVGVRSFVLHIWSHTTGGKSAALRAAISAWGDIKGIMVNANATKNGLEYFSGALKHLPLGIDEKQAADEQRFSFEDLVYMLGENQGKTRGAKGGGVQKMITWHTIAMITGEEPITSQFTGDGMQTRVLELKGKPVEDENFAKEVHNLVSDNYGYAGGEFLRAVCAMLKENNDCLLERFREIKAKMKALGVDSKQEDYIFIVTLGDILFETLILGTDAQTAETEAIENGLIIFQNNNEQKNDDNVVSAYESVRNWLIENASCFEAGAMKCYGKRTETADGYEYDVLTQPLNDYLTKAGHNVTKIISGFAERGWIPFEIDKQKKKRYSKTAWIQGAAVRAYKFFMPKVLPPEQRAEQKTFEQMQLIPIEDKDLPF